MEECVSEKEARARSTQQPSIVENEIGQSNGEKLKEAIQTVEYSNVHNEIVRNFLSLKGTLIHDYLEKFVAGANPSSFSNQILRITSEQRDQYVITVTGVSEHHVEFKKLLDRMSLLLNLIQLAKDFYQDNVIASIANTINTVLPQVKPCTQIWHEYTQLFRQVFHNRSETLKKNFDDYMQGVLISLVSPCISAELDPADAVIREKIKDFHRKHDWMDEVEWIKQEALQKFIEQNISLQHLKLQSQMNAKSVALLEHFIDKVQRELQNNPDYRGDQIEQFRLIPRLLERLMVYYSCFQIQLPLFEHAQGLLDQINEHDVTTISTSTGSGKSTLLPALLIAEGYTKVLVTQPRRLPCQLISKRVNETIIIDVGTSAKKLAGWVVSGAEYNPEAKVLYLTDALLKDRLLYDEHLLTEQTTSRRSIVLFIDEVHERSVNIDLCLGLLARLLTIRPELRSRMKVVISSATLDASVPALFRQIPQVSLGQFDIPTMTTRYRVIEYDRPNENILDLVQELCRKRQVRDQILCFVSSSTDVYHCCRLLQKISQGLVVAYPLVQGQHPDTQQLYIKQGSIFFSTTVAETSLTFPYLKYVVDTGMINTPVYDNQSKRTILKEVQAAESTIKQRRGRLGRTRPGEYYSLYDFTPDQQPFPAPQICQSDLINIEFALRKSSLHKGLTYLQQFLPDRPLQTSIDEAVEEMKKLDILQPSSPDQFTEHGNALAQLPDFGSLPMSKAVLAALFKHNCGHDLICLSAILGVLNSASLFRSIPQRFKSPDGDFMTLLNIMNEILLAKQSTASYRFDLEEVCRAKGLNDVQHFLQQALRRYTILVRFFDGSDDYRQRAQIRSGNWRSIAKALLEGYSKNVFLSMRHLQGRNLHFVRYDGGNEQLAIILDTNSTLTRPISTTPVSLVLVQDVRYATAIREKAIISFVGEIRSEWLEHSVERRVELTDVENAGLPYDNIVSSHNRLVNFIREPNFICLQGPAGSVLAAELHLRQELILETRFTLEDLADDFDPSDNFARNLESVRRITRIFNPMKRRWQIENQVEINITSNIAGRTCEVTVKGRRSENEKVKQEFKWFIQWLSYCAVIQHHDSGKKI